jgi:hypothetical protein
MCSVMSDASALTVALCRVLAIERWMLMMLITAA